MKRKKTVSHQEKDWKILFLLLGHAVGLPRERQAEDRSPGIWKALGATPQLEPQEGEKLVATSDVL